MVGESMAKKAQSLPPSAAKLGEAFGRAYRE
jgi:hypothetical protein